MKIHYDRLAIGERIRLKRNVLGFTQDEIAEKMDRASKYYADIERGSCGMSIETLLALSSTLDMSLDYIIWGKTYSKNEELQHSDEICAIIELLNNSDKRKQKFALQLLRLFLAAYNDSLHDNE